jgi:hypothetical protein
LLSSEIEFTVNKKMKMTKLIIDAAKENIFLMIIDNNSIYNVTHQNSKTNYEKLTVLINDFLKGPGSFAGIRNSLSTIKAIHLVKKIDYYCFSFQDFKGETNIKYENIPNLCDKFNIKKNLIKPIYIS